MLKILRQELHLAAILIVSLAAVVLETLRVLPAAYIPPIILLLLAVLSFFQITHAAKIESGQDELLARIKDVERRAGDQEIQLVKPPNLFEQTSSLAARNVGEVWFFNFHANKLNSNEIANRIIKPFLDNNKTQKLAFILDNKEKSVWETKVSPILSGLANNNKLALPIYRDIQEHIGFIMIQRRLDKEDREANLAVWCEPFSGAFKPDSSARAQIPRYYFNINSSSELIPRLKDIWDTYKF